MITRRTFIKSSSLATLAGAVGCGTDDASAGDAGVGQDAAPPGDDAQADDTQTGDTADEPGPDVAEADAEPADLVESVDTPDLATPPDVADYTYDGPLGPEDLFQHGVASGDPLSDRVILWTRVSQAGGEPVAVFWDVARDPEFTWRVAAGWADATADRDFTLKVDATGLAAGTTYYYRFRALGRTAPIGRTRTLPAGPTDHVRLAIGSCAEIQLAWYHAYRHLAARSDVDAFVFLGDYLYEYGLRDNRVRDVEPPTSINDLQGYRTRYAFYRRDPDLQEAHRQHPWIAVWDDHEVANNSWKGGDSAGDTAETFALRRDAGVQAWHEWLPCRTGLAAGASATDLAIHRRFDFGDLVRLTMLETRLQARDAPVNPNAPTGFDAPERTLLGGAQETWLAQEYAETPTRWVALGQQVMMGPLTVDVQPINYDQWDGYPAARQRVYDAAAQRPDVGLVVFTGDIHSSWGMDLPGPAYDGETGTGALGVEFVTPGIGSMFPGDLTELVGFAKLLNPHIRYGDATHRGYTVVDFTPERVRGTWFHVDDASQVEATVAAVAAFESPRTAPHLVETTTFDEPGGGPDLAP